jgi:SAM-dependent methyltransferase
MPPVRYDPRHIAAWYDEYGEKEWLRFEQSAAGRINFEIHRRLLAEFVREGDHVLEVGAGPGRFTLELAEIGARVFVADVSERQLALHREKTASVEAAIDDRALIDVVDLARFAEGTFDATVCYGGPISYVLAEADRAVGELLRVTRSGGYVLLSVMSLLGSVRAFLSFFPGLIERFGWERAVTDVLATGDLDAEVNEGHVMRLYRWQTLRELLERHPCQIVTVSASNFLSIDHDEEFDRDPRFVEVEVAACREPGALDGGTHIVAVVERT